MATVALCPHDFNDDDYDGWSIGAGSWSATDHCMRASGKSLAYFYMPQTDPDLELNFEYYCEE